MSSKKNTYIVIQYSGEPSGAEKRFINIWKELITRNYPVYLITHQMTVNFFSFNSLEKKYIILYQSKKLSYLSQYFAVLNLAKNIKIKSNIHFVNIYYPFLSLLTKSNFIISWLQPFTLFSITNLKLRHIILFLIAFLFSKSIDVLNPKNYNLYKKIFYFKKVFISPTSVNIDNKIFYPANKINSIVFLGRLEKNKGILKILDTIKIFDKKLNIINFNKKNKIIFYLLGNGTKQENINDFINDNLFRNIEIKNFHTINPQIYLNKSKIFLSLQKSSNYPSRALVEAMYSGCIPVISNVGDSQLMGSKKNLVYVDKNIKPNDLSDIIYDIILYKNSKIIELSSKIREEAVLLFKNNDQIKYFEKLYFNKLS